MAQQIQCDLNEWRAIFEIEWNGNDVTGLVLLETKKMGFDEKIEVFDASCGILSTKQNKNTGAW